MDNLVAKSTALGYLTAVAASAALVSVGLFFLIRESRKRDRGDRSKLYIILGIVFSALGSVLLLGITVLFLMSGLTQRMWIGEEEGMVMAYLAGIVLGTTVLCVGTFMLVDQLERSKDRRDLTKFIVGIVLMVLGAVLLVVIGALFVGKSGGAGKLLKAVVRNDSTAPTAPAGTPTQQGGVRRRRNASVHHPTRLRHARRRG